MILLESEMGLYIGAAVPLSVVGCAALALLINTKYIKEWYFDEELRLALSDWRWDHVKKCISRKSFDITKTHHKNYIFRQLLKERKEDKRAATEKLIEIVPDEEVVDILCKYVHRKNLHTGDSIDVSIVKRLLLIDSNQTFGALLGLLGRTTQSSVEEMQRRLNKYILRHVEEGKGLSNRIKDYLSDNKNTKNNSAINNRSHTSDNSWSFSSGGSKNAASSGELSFSNSTIESSADKDSYRRQKARARI